MNLPPAVFRPIASLSPPIWASGGKDEIICSISAQLCATKGKILG
jgi:hypothetical protein